MKSDIIHVDSDGSGLDQALKQVELVSEYKSLPKKNALHLRLLAEEMTGMLSSITSELEADFWIEDETKDKKDTFSLHLVTETPMNTEKREKLFAYGFMVVFIGCMLSVFQQIIGINAVLYFAPRIFESMGVSNNMLFTVIMGVINISFTLVAVFTVEKLGRKPLLISGSLGMALGALGVALSNVVSLPALVPVVCIMVYSACFMFSWGPICWVYIAEIFPNTIRSQATALAVAFQWIFNFIVSSTFVPMYNMELGSMGDSFGHCFAYALYGVICLIAALFVWRLVPETKGKTLEDMTALWRNRGKNK